MKRRSDAPTISSLDTLTPPERSERMSRVRGKHTKPELAVRKVLLSLGVRYRLHLKTLPGRPDFTIPKLKLAIFVHGCFWHMHPGCARTRLPKSPETRQFWEHKLLSNFLRDKRNRRDLRRLGWKPLVIWECQTEKPNKLRLRLRRWIGELVLSSGKEIGT